MIMSQERMILRGQAQLEKMATFVRRCSREGRPIDEVERELWRSVLALGRTLLGGHVAGVGPGDAGESLTYEGRELRRLESPHDRRYVSVFGELTIPRWVYGTRETQKHEVVPTDAVLVATWLTRRGDQRRSFARMAGVPGFAPARLAALNSIITSAKHGA